MLRIVAEDFGAWFRSQEAAQAPQAARAADQPSEHTLAPQLEEPSFAQSTAPVPPESIPPQWTIHPPSALAAITDRDEGLPSPCQHCSDKGYLLDDAGTEQVAGEELKTIAASACNCSKGREIGCGRLAEIERKEAGRRGVGWISAHRPFDHVANSNTGPALRIARER